MLVFITTVWLPASLCALAFTRRINTRVRVFASEWHRKPRLASSYSSPSWWSLNFLLSFSMTARSASTTVHDLVARGGFHLHVTRGRPLFCHLLGTLGSSPPRVQGFRTRLLLCGFVPLVPLMMADAFSFCLCLTLILGWEIFLHWKMYFK